MLLHDPTLDKRGHHRYAEKIAILKAIIEDVIQDSQAFLLQVQPTMMVDKITPLLLHGAYQAMATYGTLVSNSSSSYTEAQEILEQKLLLLDHRWKSGGACDFSPGYCIDANTSYQMHISGFWKPEGYGVRVVRSICQPQSFFDIIYMGLAISMKLGLSPWTGVWEDYSYIFWGVEQ